MKLPVALGWQRAVASEVRRRVRTGAADQVSSVSVTGYRGDPGLLRVADGTTVTFPGWGSRHNLLRVIGLNPLRGAVSAKC